MLAVLQNLWPPLVVQLSRQLEYDDRIASSIAIQTVTLAEKLKEIPVSAGVYLYKDSAGKIIYIGKAKRLRSRVHSYFREARPFDRKTDALVRQIADVEFIVTDNEVEALILEATLTKKHKPRYNVNLKDDKSYPHLKLTINEPFPKAVITRRIQKDGALYFGPFLPGQHGAAGRSTSSTELFSCGPATLKSTAKRRDRVWSITSNAALDHASKACAPPEQYQEAVRDVRLLLEGRNTELADTLEERMDQASEELRYEMAAKYRDLRKTVVKLSEQQKMATVADRDVDIFAYYREGPRLALQLFTMREGNIVGRREFFWEDLSEDDFDPASFLGEVLAQYYATDYVPKEIHVPVDFEDRELLEKALTRARAGASVFITANAVKSAT